MWEEAAGVGADVIVGVGVKAPSDAKHCDAVFNELMQECKHSAPGARLSARLRTALERMRPERRRGVVSRVRDGCAPLFVASRRGNVELVEYLVHVCDADLEQRGVYEVPHDRSTHTVTPLWCAAVAGRLGVLRALADAGAQLDASSDSGSTPVRSACFMTHVDVVRELLARGADLHRPNHTGGTCLINAVQSVPLCALLLAHGARVDAQDLQRKTALHYAAQEHRLDTARLLLDHGADASLRSRAGDDALRTAALKGAAQVVALLLAREPADAARAADALELLGATQLDEFNDAAAALQAWRRATALRAAHRAAKTGHVEAARALADAALGGAREWQTLAELAALAGDADALRTQALLVAARVLGAQHKDTVFRLMYRGAAHADAFRYQRCIELWSWALRVRIERDTLLYADTCHTASALTRLLLDAGGGRLERAGDLPRHADVLRVFTLLADHLPGGAPGGGRRAQRAHGRLAAAPVRVAPQRGALHVLRGRAGRAARVPVRARRAPAAARRRRRARAQRGALHAAARRRNTLQLLHGAGERAAGGRRAPRPAQQVRRLGRRARAAQPRLARVRPAARVARVPRRARRAGQPPRRARGRAAGHAARLPRPAPRLSA
ncbi:protein fem-1 homolog CG6966 isoform X2 [Maniola jurtina]|uniref:protein fem-1 homolog CG6966 isoform X2 n=1 Tax=Maniola jurtina TaxID=191418 RepID=UPI001E68C58E|nr:protein fem-1 homolog CG6966 isoform X2 [Maniola jurtina]